MRYLVIENKGECAPEAFLLMGASTKRSQAGQIGQFGTGWKYALALLMREKIPVVVVSGGTRYTFGTEVVNFREQEFNRITVREGRKKPDPTNFTTELGLQWTLSGAIRELISNAYDEENAEVFVSGEFMNRPGYTRVYVQYTEAVRQVYNEFDRYFTFRRKPIAFGSNWAVYEPWGRGTRMYRRGVLVFEDPDLPACFDYQYDDLDVREDRTADKYNCERYTAFIMKRLDLAELTRIVDFLIIQGAETFEGDNSYLDWYTDGMEQKMASILNGRVIVTQAQWEQFSAELSNHSVAVLPSRWVEAFRKKPGIRDLRGIVSAPRLKGYTPIEGSELTYEESRRLGLALRFAAEAGIHIDQMKTSVFEGDDSAVLGLALIDSGEILINRKVLCRTIKEIVEVLFEEFVHIDSKNCDYTRGFQNALIRHWIESLERFIPIEEEVSRAAA